MSEIHCHRCGGFIGNPAGTTFREASSTTPPVAPHSGLCTCRDAVVYRPGSGAPEPGTIYRIRSAARN